MNFLFVNQFPPAPTNPAMFPLYVLEQLYLFWLVALFVCSLKVGACDSAETSVPVDQHSSEDCSLIVEQYCNFVYYSVSSVFSPFGPL